MKRAHSLGSFSKAKVRSSGVCTRPGCGGVLSAQQVRYCSAACRQATDRHRGVRSARRKEALSPEAKMRIHREQGWTIDKAERAGGVCAKHRVLIDSDGTCGSCLMEGVRFFARLLDELR